MVLALFAMAAAFSSCGQSSPPDDDNVVKVSDYARPWGLFFDQDQSHLYVVNNLMDNIMVFDASSMEVEKTIDILCDPRYGAFNGDYSKIYITHDYFTGCDKSRLSYGELAGTYVTVIDAETMDVTKEIKLSNISGARDIQYDPEFDVMYISSSTTKEIHVMDLDSDSVTARITSSEYAWTNPIRIRYDANRKWLYVLDYTSGGDSDNEDVYILDPVAPESGSFAQVTFNPQTSGYCFGSNQPNNCSCPCTDVGSDGVCDSCGGQYCETGGMLDYCAGECPSMSSEETSTSCSTVLQEEICVIGDDLYGCCIEGYILNESSG